MSVTGHQTQRWYCLRAVTWGCAVIASLAIAFANSEIYVGRSSSGGSSGVTVSTADTAIGWPLPYTRGHQWEERFSFLTGTPRVEVGRETALIPWGLFADSAIAAVLFISVIVAVESYLRSHGNWYQFEIRDLLIVTVVLAMYLALFLNATTIQSACSNVPSVYRIRPIGDPAVEWLAVVFGASGFRFPWFVRLPLLFAIACFFWIVGDAFIKTIGCCCNFTRPTTATRKGPSGTH